MNWSILDTWTVAIGAICAVACALPGCFLVLRRMSMMGDAISHAVLPGLAVAFLITHSRVTVVMFVGAVCVGLLTAVFTQWISRFGKVDRGAAMGIVFTSLFALGLILIRQSAKHVDLDPSCVLYGSLEYCVLDMVRMGALEVPRAALSTGTVMLVNLLLCVLLFKEL
ncbi:MAG: metal ABC transporter permease, partial [Roseibacillus sp.]|nr:metal ABC transporter permease [Roseibacillus sp.]